MSGKNLVYQSVIVSTFQAEQNKEYFVLLWKGSKLLLRLWKCSQYLSCLSTAGHVTMLLFNCKTHRLSCRCAEGYSFFSNVLLLDHRQGNIASKTFRPLAVISLMSVSQNSHSVKLITQGRKDWGWRNMWHLPLLTSFVESIFTLEDSESSCSICGVANLMRTRRKYVSLEFLSSFWYVCKATVWRKPK